MRMKLWFMSLALGICAASVYADKVIFRNGDTLTGKVVGMEGDKLTFASTGAGDVKINLADVKTFSTDDPIEIKLKDGSTIHQQVGASDEPGQVVAGPGMFQQQTIAFSSMDKINPPKVEWKGSLTVGGTVTRGNSNTEALNAAFEAVRRAATDRITVQAGYLYGHQKDQTETTTTDNWFVAGKYDYFVSKKLYVYGNVKVEKDRIAHLELRVTPGVGVGYQWIEQPDFNFSTEAGLSWIHEQYSHPDETNDHFAARLAYHLDKALNDKVSVFHNVEFLPSVQDINDFNVNADAGIRASLTKSMFSEFKFQYAYDSTPAAGTRKTDLRYILSVGWKF